MSATQNESEERQEVRGSFEKELFDDLVLDTSFAEQYHAMFEGGDSTSSAPHAAAWTPQPPT